MTRLSLLVIIPLLFISACKGEHDDINLDSPEKQKMLQYQRDQYQSNLARWKTVGILNYEFTRSIDCDCEDKRDMVVSVVNGRVDNAYFVNNKGNVNEGVSGSKLKDYVSIEDFFKMIDSAIDHHYDNVDVQYDKEYGYPAVMRLMQNKQQAQNRIGFSVSHFNIRYNISFPPLQTTTSSKQPVAP